MATIVVSLNPNQAPEEGRFEEELLDRLQARNLPVKLTPHIYYLKPGHPSLEPLQADPGPLAVAAWLSPRACVCLLRQIGIDPSVSIHAVDLRTQTDAEGCAAMLAQMVAPGEAPAEPPTAPAEAETPAVRWYPVIDRERCVNCGACLEFCLFDVYARGSDGTVEVVAPDNCKHGCPACMRICPQGAILFPHYQASPAPLPRVKRTGNDTEDVRKDDLDGLMDALEELDV